MCFSANAEQSAFVFKQGCIFFLCDMLLFCMKNMWSITPFFQFIISLPPSLFMLLSLPVRGRHQVALPQILSYPLSPPPSSPRMLLLSLKPMWDGMGGLMEKQLAARENEEKERDRRQKHKDGQTTSTSRVSPSLTSSIPFFNLY